MSSTTDRPRERGQILVLLAGGLAAILIIAALAFDVGVMLVERRTQQNAADAAALAAARYVLESPKYTEAIYCSSAPEDKAVQAACALAAANRFEDSDPNEVVKVHIPPIHGIFAGLQGFVEVQIEATRPSLFGGIIGRAAWPVGVYAVAGNQQGVAFSFGMLSLSRSACKAIQIAGSGVVNIAGNIHSNSSGSECADDPIGFSRTGGGVLNVDAEDAVCRSASLIQDRGSGYLNCSPDENSFALPDPLLALAPPAKPDLPPDLVPAPGNTASIPGHCPGTTVGNKPFEATQSKACEVDRAWIFSPGLYPGGISVKGPNAAAYLLPGVYWIGGGGFSTSNGGTVISVAGATSLVPGGGVLIYNSRTQTAAAGPVEVGGGGGNLHLRPLAYPFGDGTIDLVLFQDREVCLTVKLNGSSADASSVRGIVYVPCGEVQVNGSSSVFTIDQVIAETFKINGSGGTINVLRETGIDAEVSGVGLVE